MGFSMGLHKRIFPECETDEEIESLADLIDERLTDVGSDGVNDIAFLFSMLTCIGRQMHRMSTARTEGGSWDAYDCGLYIGRCVDHYNGVPEREEL